MNDISVFVKSHITGFGKPEEEVHIEWGSDFGLRMDMQEAYDLWVNLGRTAKFFAPSDTNNDDTSLATPDQSSK